MLSFIAEIDAGVCPNLMGDSYRDALRKNTAKAWPYGCKKVHKADTTNPSVCASEIRREYDRESYRRRGASYSRKKTPAAGEKMI